MEMTRNIIVINVNSKKHSINPMIYSNFIEHLGECIHNGLWAYDPVNVPLVERPFLEKIRKDVLEAVKKIKPTVLRAFGGCYSDVYHWKDAVGPRNSRTTVKNKQWAGRWFMKILPGNFGPEIENQFGTDEFLHFCEEIGAQAYLNVNYSTGTPEEAADWVEYCNGTTNTKYGALRGENGREKPYNVKYWGIANEIWGFQEVGREKNPKNYAKQYITFANAMREKDPEIKLVAVGWHKSKWNQTVLKEIGEDWLDYLSIHHYIPLPVSVNTLIKRKHPHTEKKYYSLLSADNTYEDVIENAWNDIITILGKKTHVRIAFDEWGIWYRLKDIIKTNYNLQDGLITALILMTFQRLSHKSPMANWAQLVNVVGLVETNQDGIILTPPYLVFKMFREHAYNTLIEDITIECESFDSKKYGEIRKSFKNPYINCVCTIDESGTELALILLNRHFTDTLNVEIHLNGIEIKETGVKIELNSDSPFDYNTGKNRYKIQINEEKIRDIKSKKEYKLPAHSLTILKITKKS
ncbi:MAG: hypothetical protein EU549_01120 [Promethearchaeota archaeon]|nr:MAG: hypothetical protein EU549_01120 [Candidatus Lokiarchaeota archaeon]